MEVKAEEAQPSSDINANKHEEIPRLKPGKLYHPTICIHSFSCFFNCYRSFGSVLLLFISVILRDVTAKELMSKDSPYQWKNVRVCNYFFSLSQSLSYDIFIELNWFWIP